MTVTSITHIQQELLQYIIAELMFWNIYLFIHNLRIEQAGMGNSQISSVF